MEKRRSGGYVAVYIDILRQVGLAKNEAQIYETLLSEGESTAGHIAVKSHVHRRNVYDSLKGLISWGLIFEVPGAKETTYTALPPDRLLDIIQERKDMLAQVMPELQEVYTATSHRHEVYIYRGAEGWKNYMRDMLRIEKDGYYIGAKGGWLDERVKNFFPYFIEEAKKKNIKFHHLFDYEVQFQIKEILPYVGSDYRFLPEGFSAPGAIDLFGDQVNLLSDVKFGRHGTEISFIVIVNKDIAEAFRTWYQFMWDICPH